MRICLLDNLSELGRLLVHTTHVIQENELGRGGGVGRAVWLVERILACAEDCQGLAVRAELRSNCFTGYEVRVCSQMRIQKLLHGARQRSGSDILAGRGLIGTLSRRECGQS